MKTIIKDEEQTIEINDEGFNVDGWLNLIVGDDEAKVYTEVHIDELLAVIEGFKKRIELRHERNVRLIKEER